MLAIGVVLRCLLDHLICLMKRKDLDDTFMKYISNNF